MSSFKITSSLQHHQPHKRYLRKIPNWRIHTRNVKLHFRAWWKHQPWDVDRPPSTTDVFYRSMLNTDVFYWSTLPGLMFSWSTSTRRRLRFSTDRRQLYVNQRQPVENISLVDQKKTSVLNKTEVFYWLTSTRLSFSIGRHPGRLSTLSTSILLTFSSRPRIVLHSHWGNNPLTKLIE